jgi:YVTN family beta-propeller protein
MMRRLAIAAAFLLAVATASAASFVTFETGQVRPLALSPDGTRLFATNTPDNRLEIFSVSGAGLTHTGSVPVGLEPLAVAARSNTEVWVVNHLSDSVSIVDVGTAPPRVTRTLLVGDEPRDIVFAGPGGNRAFITAAHRGQNRPGDPQLTTQGVGRADVWVFDATNLGTTLGGTPLTILSLFGDTPRALATSPDGSTVYAAVFHSGNQTTTLSEGVICNGGAAAAPCTLGGTSYPGGLPAPNANVQGTPQPEVGLIVRFNNVTNHWEDELGRNWNNGVRFSLPDLDVFAINANAGTPAQTASFAHVGTILFNMVTNPVTGKVYVSNSEARNEARFEGPGTLAGHSVRGHLHEARITVLDGASVLPRHLNKHLDYNVVPTAASDKAKSFATPTALAVTANGQTLYVAAFGSSQLGVFSTAQLEADTFVPTATNHIAVSGGGPSGLVLDEAHGRLYVFTRFDDSISVINTGTSAEIAHLPVYNPEPASVKNGRPVLYDAVLTSSNGEASCSSCHVFGDFDSLAWDLGNPDDVVLNNPNPFRVTDPLGMSFPDFHPLKGPMTTQSLRGMANNGPMHWRGDRTAGNDPGGDPLDEVGAFKKFIIAFDGLLGRGAPISDADMQRFTDFILQVTYPPNPIRNLDNSLTPDQQAGHDKFMATQASDVFQPCHGCHALDPANGHFGTDGFSSFEFETQLLKIPHLRNAYQKIGMFGMPQIAFLNAGDNGDKGPQIRGFGFLHDGSVDTVLRFHNATVFNQNNPAGFPISNPGGFPNGSAGDPQRRQMEQFILAFDSDMAPIVGQQTTLTASNGGVAGPRIDLLIARAAAGECDLVVKGTRDGEQRGAVRLASGQFRTDRASEALFTDAQMRAFATPGQELTYTCVPPGSGMRIGVDRDEDGFFDRDELDAGSDPADPSSIPAGATTTTSTTVPGGSTTTTTTPPQATLVQATALKLTDDLDPPGFGKFSFRSSTKKDPTVNRIVIPAPGGPSDPRTVGMLLRYYNSGGLTSDSQLHVLDAHGWTLLGSPTAPKGYRFRGKDIGDSVIKSATVTADSIKVKGFSLYSLDEPAQGRIAVRISSGLASWCADAPAKTSGNPPSTAKNDRPGKFTGQPKTPAPIACPAPPGSPSGAFVVDAEG